MNNDKCIQKILLPDPDATQRLGQALATAMIPGFVTYLKGDLGAGKTILARALLYAIVASCVKGVAPGKE